MSKQFPKVLKVRVTQHDIEEGVCQDPNKCMLKLAIKRAIGGHGYVHVQGGVVSLTRRSDYRENGVLPRIATTAMLNYDDKRKRHLVKPFTFSVTLHTTTKIANGDRLAKLAANNRKIRAAPGYKAKKYTMRQRIAGIAIGGEAA